MAFFHPFPDGNARLAMLTLAYILELDGVRLDQTGPLQTTRYADDAAGAADLAALVSVLIRSTGSARTHGHHCHTPWSLSLMTALRNHVTPHLLTNPVT